MPSPTITPIATMPAAAAQLVLFTLMTVSYCYGAPFPLALSMPLVLLQGGVVIAFLWKRQAYLPLMFVGFLLYSIIPLYTQQVLNGMPFSSWRASTASFDTVKDAVHYYVLFLNFVLLSSYLIYTGHRPIEAAPAPAIAPPVTAALLAVSAATFFFTARSSRDAWIIQAGTGDRFVVLATTMALAASAAFVARSRPGLTATRDWRLWCLLGVGFVGSAAGFRFMLVATLCGMLAAVGPRIRMTAGRVATGAAVLTFAMLGLLYFAAGRTAQMNGMETVSAAFSGRLSLTSALAYFGAAEQLNMMAIYHFLSTDQNLMFGRTYWDGVLRILPNPIYNAYFEVVRPQDVILQNSTFLSAWFQKSGLNIGSHFVLEAMINFGRFGPFFVAATVLIGFRLLERSRASRVGEAVYIGGSALAYSIAWYGFGNYAKYTLYFAAVYLLLSALGGKSAAAQSRGISHAGTASTVVLARARQ
jgi:hypothetical protein